MVVGNSPSHWPGTTEAILPSGSVPRPEIEHEDLFEHKSPEELEGARLNLATCELSTLKSTCVKKPMFSDIWEQSVFLLESIDCPMVLCQTDMAGKFEVRRRSLPSARILVRNFATLAPAEFCGSSVCVVTRLSNCARLEPRVLECFTTWVSKSENERNATQSSPR
jgi:hypothetical protein